MTVVSNYNLTSGHLWNGCFAEMRLMIQEEKHNIYLEKGKSTNTHQIWTLPKDSSENLQQVKFVWGHHPKWSTQTGTSLIWWTEWATLIDSLTALWISSGYPVCEWGLHLRYPESTKPQLQVLWRTKDEELVIQFQNVGPMLPSAHLSMLLWGKEYWSHLTGEITVAQRKWFALGLNGLCGEDWGSC